MRFLFLLNFNDLAFCARMAVVVLALALSACAAPTERDGLVTLPSCLGGRIAAKMVEIAELNATGQSYRLDGEYTSSCTMYLGLDRVCVTPDTRFKFHAPQKLIGIPIVMSVTVPLSPPLHRIWVAQMMGHYPEGIRETVRPALDVPHKYSIYTGAELHAIDPQGVRGCR